MQCFLKCKKINCPYSKVSCNTKKREREKEKEGERENYSSDLKSDEKFNKLKSIKIYLALCKIKYFFISFYLSLTNVDNFSLL